MAGCGGDGAEPPPSSCPDALPPTVQVGDNDIRGTSIDNGFPLKIQFQSDLNTSDSTEGLNQPLNESSLNEDEEATDYDTPVPAGGSRHLSVEDRCGGHHKRLDSGDTSGGGSSHVTKDGSTPVSEQTQPETPPPLSDNEDHGNAGQESDDDGHHHYDNSSNSSGGDEPFLPSSVVFIESNFPHDTHLVATAAAAANAPTTTAIAAYNPMTCYSPNRRSPARREIMGMSVFSAFLSSGNESNLMSNDSSYHRHPPPLLETVQSEDDSEAALEMVAQHIRTEMLHSEMLELAAEAERAADAGEDHFAAKPCSFQDDMQPQLGSSSPYHIDTSVPHLAVATTPQFSPRKLAMRRCMSEGSYVAQRDAQTPRSSATAALLKRRYTASRIMDPLSTASSNHNARDKLSVVELRNVNEVFPSFRQFHTHLRTHFYRSQVDQGQLFFCELQSSNTPEEGVKQNPKDTRLLSIEKPPLHLLPLCTNHSTATPIQRMRKCRKSNNPMDQVQASFLRTFSLDQWTGPNRPWTRTSTKSVDVEQANAIPEDDDDDDFIHTLASEQCTDGPHRMVPRKIEVPPGLYEGSSVSDDRLVPSSAVNLRPKSSSRIRFGIDWEGTFDPVPPRNAPRLNYVRSFSPTLDFCVTEPRSLLDATDNDTDEMETSGSVDASDGRTTEAGPLSGMETTRRNSSDAEDDRELLSPNTFDVANLESASNKCGPGEKRTRSNSIISPDSSSDLVELSNPDFVTPARLRYIRGLRRSSSNDYNELTSDNCPSLPQLTSTHLELSKRELTSVVDMSESYTATTEWKDNSTSICSDHVKAFDFSSHVDVTGSDSHPDGAVPTDAELSSVSIFDSSKLLASSEPISLIAAVGLQHRQSVGHQNLSACGSFGSQVNVVTDPTSSPSIEYIHQLQDEYIRALEYPPSPHSVQSIANLMAEHPLKESPSVVKFSPPFLPFEVPALPNGHKSDLVKHSVDGKDPPLDAGHESERKALDSTAVDKRPAAPGEAVPDHDFLARELGKARSFPDVGLLATPQQQDCSCLSLSPTASVGSDDDSVEAGNPLADQETPTTLRRSTSTGALHDSGIWSDFIDSSRSPAKSISAAMNIISKLSPRHYRERQQALYTRMKENDDFMNNFLYCSKTADESDLQVTEAAFQSEPCLDGNLSCGDADAGYCCTPFLGEALTLGAIFHASRQQQRTTMQSASLSSSRRRLVTLSSSGVAASQNRDPRFHSWFEWLDSVVDHWVDGSRRRRKNPTFTNVSFQAPSLRKCEDPRSSCSSGTNRPIKLWAEVGKENDETETLHADFTTGKFDGIGLYDIDTSENTLNSVVERPLGRRHSRHLSLLEDAIDSLPSLRQDPHSNGSNNSTPTNSPIPAASSSRHSRHDLSDSQFEIIYGVSRQRFEAKAQSAHALGWNNGR